MLYWIVFAFFVVCFLFIKDKEHFGSYTFGFPTRINRPTKNSSYDIRGEAYYPPLINFPFDNSSIAPNPLPVLLNNRILTL